MTQRLATIHMLQTYDRQTDRRTQHCNLNEFAACYAQTALVVLTTNCTFAEQKC